MIVLGRLLTLVVTLAFGVGVIALAPASAQERPIEASLAFESQTPKPGASVTLAISMNTASGWTGFWAKPGWVGLPVATDWHVPAGIHVSSLRHPAPTLL